MKQLFLKIKRWFRLIFHNCTGQILFKGEKWYEERFVWANHGKDIRVQVLLVKCDVCGFEFVNIIPLTPGISDSNMDKIKRLHTPYYVRETMMPKEELKEKND
ncbi:MAG: hypothetical protein PHX21_13125 [bacterium]|nr:hypothetical protein [bacterium]